ncbi:MAG TPA: endonuclease I [Psychromonas hadalis]|nr:endonuclease I [Psychromonas hadalis]
MTNFFKYRFTLLLLLAPLLVSPNLAFSKNINNDSFSKAKKLLEKQVYTENAYRVTIYCGASFNTKKKITAKNGFSTHKYRNRAKKIEWEHVVPAENFGRNFVAWRDGDAKCVNSKGKHYKGRRCANKVDEEYKLMQADMYNLYPAIGSVNAARSNYNFVASVSSATDFGQCAMKIEKRKAEPPVKARGQIARSYLYMDKTYSQYKMSKQQRQLMKAWNKQYPPTQWECERGERIRHLQQSNNQILVQRCGGHS